MTPSEVRAGIAAFGAHYSYDTAYLQALYDAAPGAHTAFSAAMPLSRHREALPRDAHFIARVAAMHTDDCGACTQLNLRMAVEAGVDRTLLRTLLEAPEHLPADLALVRAHAIQVVSGENADPERLARLTERYGAHGVAELATAIAGGRLFPTLKRALGLESACALPHLDF